MRKSRGWPKSGRSRSNLRYDTGEEIYDEDCETLAELGIVRS
jgi:hypothetical protein